MNEGLFSFRKKAARDERGPDPAIQVRIEERVSEDRFLVRNLANGLRSTIEIDGSRGLKEGQAITFQPSRVVTSMRDGKQYLLRGGSIVRADGGVSSEGRKPAPIPAPMEYSLSASASGPVTTDLPDKPLLLGQDEIAPGPEVPEEPEERLTEEAIEPVETGPSLDTHTVEFYRGRLFAHVGGARIFITNAEESFLLPGDRIRVELTSEREGLASDIQNAGRETVVGRLEYRYDSPDNPDDRSLRFVVRAPGPGGTLDKFRFRADPVIDGMSEEEVKKLVDERAYILFDRGIGKVTEILPEKSLSSYEAGRLAALTNLGIEKHGEEALQLKQNEREQLAALLRSYHVPKTVSGRGVITAAAREMRSKINREVEEGRMEDFRKGGRVVIAVDSKGTQMRDDAFSIGPSKRGDGWVEIGIHIADPRALIPAGSALDRSAAERSTGIFLPDDRQPLLPDELTRLGSLDEGADRRAFAFVFEAKLGPDHEGVQIRDMRFTPTAIRVDKALAHDEADALLEGEGEPAAGVPLAWNTFASVMNEVNQRGVVRRNAEPTGFLEDSSAIVATANMIFNRAAAEGFGRMKSSKLTRLKRLQDAVLGMYRGLERDGTTVELTQGTEPRENDDFGGKYAYVSSPLRDYSSIVGMRALAFLADLRRRGAEGKDISAAAARKLTERYARDVVGITLSEETLALPGDKFPAAASAEARAYLDSVLEHALGREELVRRTERAITGMKTLDNIGATIHEQGALALPDGILVEFTDPRQSPSVEDGIEYAYATVRVTKRTNSFIASFKPPRTDNVRLGVKFALPRGMRMPTPPAKIYLGGEIAAVDVEKSRLILRVDEEYGSPDPNPSPRRRRRRR